MNLLLHTTLVLQLCVPAPLAVVPEPGGFKQTRKGLFLAARNGDRDLVSTFVAEMAGYDDVRSAKALVQICLEFPHAMYELTIPALAHYENPKVVDYYFDTGVKQKNPLVRLLYYEVIGRLRTDSRTSGALAAGMADKSPVVAYAVVELVASQKTKEAIDALVGAFAGLGKRSKGVRNKLVLALQDLTRKGIEDGEDWANWWLATRESFVFPKEGDESSGTGVVERLRRRGDSHWVEEMVEGDILVVPGVYDEVQLVLDELGFPFQVISQADLTTGILKPSSVLVFNCDEQKNRLKPAAAKAVSQFVQSGGYLFTSDWELQNVLLGSFPKTFNFGPMTQDEIEVPIEGVPENVQHPLLRDVLPANPMKNAGFQWTVDAASMLITLKPGKYVYPLVRAPQLKQKFHHDTVAINVLHGKGSILHVLGHFRAQKSENTDGFALQQLLANFVVEKQKHRRQKKD